MRRSPASAQPVGPRAARREASRRPCTSCHSPGKRSGCLVATRLKEGAIFRPDLGSSNGATMASSSRKAPGTRSFTRCVPKLLPEVSVARSLVRNCLSASLITASSYSRGSSLAKDARTKDQGVRTSTSAGHEHPRRRCPTKDQRPRTKDHSPIFRGCDRRCPTPSHNIAVGSCGVGRGRRAPLAMKGICQPRPSRAVLSGHLLDWTETHVYPSERNGVMGTIGPPASTPGVG
jgi:hypothetical protein